MLPFSWSLNGFLKYSLFLQILNFIDTFSCSWNLYLSWNLHSFLKFYFFEIWCFACNLERISSSHEWPLLSAAIQTITPPSTDCNVLLHLILLFGACMHRSGWKGGFIDSIDLWGNRGGVLFTSRGYVCSPFLAQGGAHRGLCYTSSLSLHAAWGTRRQGSLLWARQRWTLRTK